MARKLNKNLVAIGSAAIATIYGIGLARTATTSTGAAAVAAAATPPPVVSTDGRSPATSAGAAIARAIASATPAPPAASGAVRYQDGTFTGAGSNRFGEIDVAVTIQGGAISDVRITRATTRYPVSRIARLPGEVVQRQSAPVDYVSGATYSSRAFRDAVTQALAQSGAKPSSGTTQQS